MKQNKISDVELANSISHYIGVGLAIIGFCLLMIKSFLDFDFTIFITDLIFSLSMILMYTMSGTYHVLVNPKIKQLFKKFDHMAIYILIAGTYTPFCMRVISQPKGLYIVIVQWLIVILGVFFKIHYVNRFKKISTLLYLLMGWIVVLVLPDIVRNISPSGLTWLVAGGLFYTIGTFFYLVKVNKYHHAIWHLFVLAGTFSHFIAIYLFI